MRPSSSETIEERIEAILKSLQPPEDWHDVLEEIYRRYRDQAKLLDRLIHISDRFQSAERERSHDYMARYERQVRQLEKIVRISDQYQSMLRDLKKQLEHAANYDALTGLANRRYMARRLDEAAAEALRVPERTFALMIADVDHFKSINDRLGHAVGDQVLKAIAQAMCEVLREYDLCARWGGEEFLLIFPGCTDACASNIADRLLRTVPKMSLPKNIINKPTISIGVTIHRPGEHVDETVRRADAALYQAKAEGRNRVVQI
jgi:diguanylate cyclase (GGDEF)-like protein